MSKPTQALIGAACVAVLAFVGYYFWTEHQRAETAALTQRCEDYYKRLGSHLAAKAGVAGPSEGWLDEQVESCVRFKLR